MSENSYLHHFSAQVSQIVFLRLFDRFTAFYNCMTWNVRKLISPPFQCTSITNRVLRLFDRFPAYYNCMTWNVRKLISPPLQCTSITNRFLSLFDHFTAYYNCMTWNVKKLTSPPFKCRSNLQIVFIAYLTILRLITTVWPEMSENSYLHHFSAQISQIVFFVYLTVLRLITTVWPEMSKKSYLRHFSPLKWWRYEFCDISGHTVVISRKMVK